MPLPRPDATAVSHALLSTAVQVQDDDDAVIVNVPPPPEPGTVAAMGDTENVQVIPAWLIVTDWPATVTVVERKEAVVLAVTAMVTVSLPVPVAPEETETHVVDSVAAQA